MPRILAALALVAVAAAVAGCAGLGGGDDVSLVPEGDRSPAPAFRVERLDGSGELSLADYPGTPVVLNFWASWCEPCQEEMPALVEFSEAATGVQVVGLAVTDVPADSRAFAREAGADFPLGIDRRGDTIAKFGATGLPVTVFVDDEGRIAQTAYGGLTRQQFEAYAEALGA